MTMGSITQDIVLVPLATERDAEETCAALRDYVGPETRIVAVHVIEKAGGAPDKAGVTQREKRADNILLLARQRLELDDIDVGTQILYGTNVADTITDFADEVDADLIAFSPREASRLSRLLSGDVALDLITTTNRPVLVLPTVDFEEEG